MQSKKNCRMFQWEHSSLLSTFIRLPFVIQTFFCLFWVAVLHRFILTGKRELVVLLCLSSWYLVFAVWPFLTMPQAFLQFVTVCDCLWLWYTDLLFYCIVCAWVAEIFSWTPRPCSTILTVHGMVTYMPVLLISTFRIDCQLIGLFFKLCYTFSMVSNDKSVGPLTSRCSFPTARRSGVRPRISLKSTFRWGFSSSILWTVGISPNSAA